MSLPNAMQHNALLLSANMAPKLLLATVFRSVSRNIIQGGIHMKQTVLSDDEPIGIVISRGWEPETTPRFSAYVWAPCPDDEIENDVQTA